MTASPVFSPRHVNATDLFSIGIGPSSSHTVGPMRAATAFVGELRNRSLIDLCHSINITLYGSIAATGVGHGTLGALMVGLAGGDPATCDPELVQSSWNTAISEGWVELLGGTRVQMSADHLRYEPFTRMPRHANAIRFVALNVTGEELMDDLYYSVGGGFIERDGVDPPQNEIAVPYPYTSAAELLQMCSKSGLDIAGIALANEISLSSEEHVNAQLDAIWHAMVECIESGMLAFGTLPGWLKVPRRAASISSRLRQREGHGDNETTAEWLQCYAIAVNEQNASGARVVTAPTNGAAGIIPAVGYYASKFRGMTSPVLWRRYLLTAGAIGALCKMNASISGAEAGCQGEVGSACSMAAAGLTAILGGTPAQIENAAEVAMEHHLGLTCDPVGGFVQIPCIERNAIASGTAVSSSLLALMGDGTHMVSLDTVIETMRQTGRDMSTNYKETSRGGLAVNIVEC